MIEAILTSSADTDSGAGRACAVKLPVFEGPLDLLLSLIRSNEVDISDIPIALISEQYLEYLNLMHRLDINVAADYLLMAATLAHIKSQILLPPAPGEGDEDESEDPRAELVRRLAEYAVFKEVAAEFQSRPILGRDVFKALCSVSEPSATEPDLHVSLFALVEAMRRVLSNISEEEFHHQVALEQVTLRERMLAVMDQLSAGQERSLRFEDLLRDGALTRHRTVMTFLAILELAKIQALRLFQNVSAEGLPEGPLRVRLAVENSPDADSVSAAGAEAERTWELDNQRALEKVSGGTVDIDREDS